MFYGAAARAGMAEAAVCSAGVSEVRIDDCDPAAFEQLLRWVYTGRVDLNSANVGHVACLADRYCLVPLRRVCARFMRVHVNGSNCMQFWYNARKVGDKLLQACCFRVIVDHFDSLRTNPEFKQAKRLSFTALVLTSCDTLPSTHFALPSTRLCTGCPP